MTTGTEQPLQLSTGTKCVRLLSKQKSQLALEVINGLDIYGVL